MLINWQEFSGRPQGRLAAVAPAWGPCPWAPSPWCTILWGGQPLAVGQLVTYPLLLWTGPGCLGQIRPPPPAAASSVDCVSFVCVNVLKWPNLQRVHVKIHVRSYHRYGVIVLTRILEESARPHSGVRPCPLRRGWGSWAGSAWWGDGFRAPGGSLPGPVGRLWRGASQAFYGSV